MTKIKKNNKGEYLLGRVEIRTNQEDVIHYIRLRLSSYPSRKLPKTLGELLFELRRDIVLYGKEYIKRFRPMTRELMEDHHLKSVKIAERYFANAEVEGK